MIAPPAFSAWASVPLHLVRGEMNITRSLTTMSLPAGTNLGLPSLTDFRKINTFEEGINQYGGFTFVNSNLVIPEDGFYEASGYANINHPANNSDIAVVFIINDTYFSPRTLKSFANDGGVYRLAAGEGSAWFTKGTQLGLAVASNNATTGLIVSDSTIKVQLLSRNKAD